MQDELAIRSSVIGLDWWYQNPIISHLKNLALQTADGMLLDFSDRCLNFFSPHFNMKHTAISIALKLKEIFLIAYMLFLHFWQKSPSLMEARNVKPTNHIFLFSFVLTSPHNSPFDVNNRRRTFSSCCEPVPCYLTSFGPCPKDGNKLSLQVLLPWSMLTVLNHKPMMTSTSASVTQG